MLYLTSVDPETVVQKPRPHYHVFFDLGFSKKITDNDHFALTLSSRGVSPPTGRLHRAKFHLCMSAEIVEEVQQDSGKSTIQDTTEASLAFFSVVLGHL